MLLTLLLSSGFRSGTHLIASDLPRSERALTATPASLLLSSSLPPNLPLLLSPHAGKADHWTAATDLLAVQALARDGTIETHRESSFSIFPIFCESTTHRSFIGEPTRFLQLCRTPVQTSFCWRRTQEKGRASDRTFIAKGRKTARQLLFFRSQEYQVTE